MLNGAQYTHRESLSPVAITSSGMVNVIQIMPVLDRNADNHPHTRNDAKSFKFSHPEPTTHAAVGTFVNGLQRPADWWYGTTARYDGQTLILVMDFTSLPFEERPVGASPPCCNAAARPSRRSLSRPSGLKITSAPTCST